MVVELLKRARERRYVCPCCLPVRTASLIVGISNALIILLALILRIILATADEATVNSRALRTVNSVFFPVFFIDLVADEINDAPSKARKLNFHWVLPVYLVLLASCALLVIGVVKKRKNFLLAYLFVLAMEFAAGVVIILLYWHGICMYSSRCEKFKLGFFDLLKDSIYTTLKVVYCCIVVYFYILLKKNQI